MRTGRIHVLVVPPSVGDVGQQGDLTSPLDGLRQLALMHGAGAGGSAGQNLGTLRDEAAQLGGVLIINVLALLGAELADLAALAPRRAGRPGFTIKSHEISSFIPVSGGRFSRPSNSKRQLSVLLADLGEVRPSPKTGGRGPAVAGGRTVGGRRPVRGAAVIAAVPFGVPEVDVVGHDLGAAALAAVPVGPVADLQAALHHGHAALGEVFADEFRSAAPGHHVDEIRLLLAALGLEVPVAGDGEGCDGGAALGAAQFGVTGQTAHENDLVQHPGSSLLALADDQGTHDAVGDTENAVQLLGEGRFAGEAHQHVVAVVFVVDGIGETPGAPLLHLDGGAVLLSQGLELRNQSGDVLLPLCRVDDIHDLVIGSNLCHVCTNTGFVLNAMHSREGCYTYIKEIIKGESYIVLGEEEKIAVEKAINVDNFME